jgi:hypothetical protein
VAGGPEPANVLKIFQIIGIRPPAGGGRGGGGGGGRGGGAGGLAGTGDYLVTMTVGGKTLRQVLRVERVGSGDAVGGSGGGEIQQEPKSRIHSRFEK